MSSNGDHEMPDYSDDSVSVNSTLQSDRREEYPLECILAERESNGSMEYLVKWEGYSDIHCTWEPETNFQNDTTLAEWEHQKMRVKRGLDKLYNVHNLETRVEKWIVETGKRKARRRAKRVRLGLPVAPEEVEELVEAESEFGEETAPQIGDVTDEEYSSSNNRDEGSSSSSSEALEDNHMPLERPRKLRQRASPARKSSRSVTRKSRSSGNHIEQQVSKPAASSHSRKRKVQVADPDEDVDMEFRRVSDITSTDTSTRMIDHSKITERPSSNVQSQMRERGAVTSNLDKSSQTTKPIEARRNPEPSIVPKVAKLLPAKLDPPHKTQVGQAGRGPARLGGNQNTALSGGKSRVTGTAIFRNWDTDTKSRTKMSSQLSSGLKGSPKTSTFPNLSTQRRHEKAGRHEPPPDPEKLTFVNLKDGKVADKPSNILLIPDSHMRRKTPFKMIQENLTQASMSSTTVGEKKAAINDDIDMDLPFVAEDTIEKPHPVVNNNAFDSSTLEQFPRQDENDNSKAQPERTPSSKVPTGPSNRTPIFPKKQSFPVRTDQFSPGVDISQGAMAIVSKGQALPDSDVIPQGAAPTVFEAPKNNVRRSSFPAFGEDGLGIINSDALERDVSRKVSLPSSGSLPLGRERRGPSQTDPFHGDPSNYPASPVVPSHSEYDAVRPVPLRKLQGDIAYLSGILEPGRLRKGSLENYSDILGTVVVGDEYINVGDVRFRGLVNKVKQLFMTIKVPPRQVHLWCNKICTAEDYKRYFHNEESIYIAAGHIVPWPQTVNAIGSVSETLKIYNSGGLFFSSQYTVIVYPSGEKSWTFFDNVFPETSPKAHLRFVMRLPISKQLANSLTVASGESRLSDPGSFITESGQSVNALFQQFFGIEYQKLLPQGKARTPQAETFYLLYPLELNEEYNVLVNWLQANEAKIYSSRGTGEWEKFTTADHGVVLIHDSVHRLHMIPHLARLLRKPFNLWFLNLRSNHPDPDFSHREGSLAIQQPGTLERLFPHGAGILLTDSLFLNHPAHAVRILTWFRVLILHIKPAGTWRLVTRNLLREWILDIISEKFKEDGRVFMEIYEQIYRLLPMELMDEYNNYETPKEDAPLVCSRNGMSGYDHQVGLGDKEHDIEGIAMNDNRLVEWFAGWSRTKVGYHRKFHVVYGSLEDEDKVRKEWTKRWSYILVLNPDQFLKMHAIPEWEVKNRMHTEDREKRREARRASVPNIHPQSLERSHNNIIQPKSSDTKRRSRSPQKDLPRKEPKELLEQPVDQSEGSEMPVHNQDPVAEDLTRQRERRLEPLAAEFHKTSLQQQQQQQQPTVPTLNQSPINPSNPNNNIAKSPTTSNHVSNVSPPADPDTTMIDAPQAAHASDSQPPPPSTPTAETSDPNDHNTTAFAANAKVPPPPSTTIPDRPRAMRDEAPSRKSTTDDKPSRSLFHIRPPEVVARRQEEIARREKAAEEWKRAHRD